MPGVRYFRFIGRAILLLLGGAAVYVIAVIVVNLVAWRQDDKINERRLRILQADSILRCAVTNIRPFREQEEMDADIAGTTHGIGWGGRAPTTVTRMFTLNGGDPADVISAYTLCAQSSGWMLEKQRAIPLSARRSFTDGWNAYLNIYFLNRTPFTDQPVIQISLTADLK
jgi:hypothetical protein